MTQTPDHETISTASTGRATCSAQEPAAMLTDALIDRVYGQRSAERRAANAAVFA